VKAWLFVEGTSDRLGLESLWAAWRGRLREKRHGVAIVPLDNKANLLKRLGHRGAEKLVGHNSDIVVGMPDLYPVQPFVGTEFAHEDATSLKELQTRSVRNALTSTFGISHRRIDAYMERFLPAVFKHDFEMLLLAAKDALRTTLRTTERLGQWRQPVEDQDIERPPKRVVEELFRTKLKKRYLDTRDAPRILRGVTDPSPMLRTDLGRATCPEFIEVLRWLGERFGDPFCTLP